MIHLCYPNIHLARLDLVKRQPLLFLLWLYQWYHLSLTFPSPPRFHYSLPIAIWLSLHILHVDYVTVSIIYPLLCRVLEFFENVCAIVIGRDVWGENYICVKHTCAWQERWIHMTSIAVCEFWHLHGWFVAVVIMVQDCDVLLCVVLA